MENLKTLNSILKQYYSEPMVKKIRTGDAKPSYQKMIILRDKHGISLDFWEDVRSWVQKQKELEGRKKRKEKK